MEKAAYLLLLNLLFIIYTFPQNQEKQKPPWITPQFLLDSQVFTHQEATASGSYLSLYTKEYLHDWHSNSVSGIWLLHFMVFMANKLRNGFG